MDASAIFIGFFILLIVAGIVGVIVAYYGGGFISDKFFEMLWGADDDNYKFEPQYSIAKARIAAGRFEDAIQEFRNAMPMYPQDLTVHFHIADVYAEYLKQPLDALAELDFGQRRCKKPDQIARFVLRKAEIHLVNRRDPGNAALEIEAFLEQYPKAKTAVMLNEKLQQIRRVQDGEAPHPAPYNPPGSDDANRMNE